MKRNLRLEQIEMIGKHGLEQLHNATVVIFGLGNIGGQLIYHLALLGIGLILVDREMVSGENLGTQGFTPDQLGMPKVQARAETLAKLNPACRIETVSGDIESLGLAKFWGVDLGLCCLDSPRIRTVVNEMAIRGGYPWIDAAIDGSGKSLMGRVTAYDPRDPDTPCFLCPYEGDALQHILQEAQPESCTYPRLGVARHGEAEPTIAFSALGGAVVSVQTVWALKTLLGRGTELMGREVYMDLDGNRMRAHRQKRNPLCVIDHRTFSTIPLGYSQGTVHQAFKAAEAKLGTGVILQLHRRALVTLLTCPDCQKEIRPYQLYETLSLAIADCPCGCDLKTATVRSQDFFTRADVVDFGQKTWREIGLPENDVVTASKGEAELHFVLTDA